MELRMAVNDGAARIYGTSKATDFSPHNTSEHVWVSDARADDGRNPTWRRLSGVAGVPSVAIYHTP